MNSVVGNNVLKALGRPANLFQLQVRWLWDDHFRVNVLVGEHVADVLFAHSFFVVTDDQGAILGATPGIKRHYETVANCSA